MIIFVKFFREAFESIHEKCLYDTEFANKTVAMVSAASFHSVTIHDVNLRKLFFNQSQNDFESK